MPGQVKRTVAVIFNVETVGITHAKHDGVVDVGFGNGFYWITLENGIQYRYAVPTIARIIEAPSA